jgi:sugar phosphate isomerase/epimerase
MYLSLNSMLVAGRAPWPELARLAAKVGYPAVDVDLGAAMKEGLAATNSLLGGLKLKPAAVNFPVEFRKDDAAFRKDLERLPDAASFSAAIGCPRMVTWIMPSSKTPKAELRALYLKRFRACADVLARSHVRLGLEFLGPLHLRRMEPHEFIWRMNEMLAFGRECGPNVGLLLDVWHWYHAGATTGDILKAGKDGIVHVHLSDAPKLPPDQIRDNERLMPGAGVIDLVGFFRALKEIGYQDFVSIEVFGRFLRDMTPEEDARRGLEAARGVMREAGVA